MMPLNCSAEKYFNVFTGSRLRTKNLRPIIDFVPFGYDLDKLEMRLYEGYQHVEAYVIYEAPLTQTGQTKPFYFEAVRNTSRFLRFADKIIYLKGNRTHLSSRFLGGNHLDQTRRNLRGHKKLNWKMEGSMRWEIIRLLKESVKVQNDNNDMKLKERILQSAELTPLALAIQNDADEMMLGDTLYHLKYCELKKDIQYPLYAPCLAFKKNFYWLQGLTIHFLLSCVVSIHSHLYYFSVYLQHHNVVRLIKVAYLENGV